MSGLAFFGKTQLASLGCLVKGTGHLSSWLRAGGGSLPGRGPPAMEWQGLVAGTRPGQTLHWTESLRIAARAVLFFFLLFFVFDIKTNPGKFYLV